MFISMRMMHDYFRINVPLGYLTFRFIYPKVSSFKPNRTLSRCFIFIRYKNIFVLFNDSIKLFCFIHKRNIRLIHLNHYQGLHAFWGTNTLVEHTAECAHMFYYIVYAMNINVHHVIINLLD